MRLEARYDEKIISLKHSMQFSIGFILSHFADIVVVFRFGNRLFWMAIFYPPLLCRLTTIKQNV